MSYDISIWIARTTQTQKSKIDNFVLANSSPAPKSSCQSGEPQPTQQLRRGPSFLLIPFSLLFSAPASAEPIDSISKAHFLFVLHSLYLLSAPNLPCIQQPFKQVPRFCLLLVLLTYGPNWSPSAQLRTGRKREDMIQGLPYTVAKKVDLTVKTKIVSYKIF